VGGAIAWRRWRACSRSPPPASCTACWVAPDAQCRPLHGSCARAALWTGARRCKRRRQRMGCSLPCAAGSARVRIDAETQNMGLCAVLLLLHGPSAWRGIAVWEGRALLQVSECSPTATSPCAQPRDTAATCLWPLAASLPAPCSATACQPRHNLPKPFKPTCAPMPHANECPAQRNRPVARTDRWTARR
jgi:hypothetical protein